MLTPEQIQEHDAALGWFLMWESRGVVRWCEVTEGEAIRRFRQLQKNATVQRAQLQARSRVSGHRVVVLEHWPARITPYENLPLWEQPMGNNPTTPVLSDRG